MSEIYHITARHKNSLKVVDMYYSNIKEAQKRNPGYDDFAIVGIKK